KPARHQFTIDGEENIGAVLVDRRAAHLVGPTQVRLDADGDTEPAVLALRHTISHFEGQALKLYLPPVVKLVDTAAVVGAGRGARRQAQMLHRHIFDLERVRRGRVRAAALAATAERTALDLL